MSQSTLNQATEFKLVHIASCCPYCKLVQTTNFSSFSRNVFKSQFSSVHLKSKLNSIKGIHSLYLSSDLKNQKESRGKKYIH